MDLYPAVDVKDGRVVRLLRGDYAAETEYDPDPVSRARAFAEDGAPWIHVVDLDAALTGEPVNFDVLAAICSLEGVSVQVGGGIRDRAAVDRLLAAGAGRVVLGTAAVEDPEFADGVARDHPARVAVGLDASDGIVRVRGWTESGGMALAEALGRFAGSAVTTFVVTAIGRDGTMDGPDLEQLTEVLEFGPFDVVASGGVGNLDDIEQLASLGASGRRLSGAIVGRALYEGRFTVAEALDVVRRAGIAADRVTPLPGEG